MKINLRCRLGNQQGSVIGLVAICMIAFIAVMAFVLELGHLQTVRDELQNAADAGALAGARALLPLNLQNPPPPGFPYCSLAQQVARDTAAANKSDVEIVAVVTLADAKLIRWDWQTNTRNDTPSCNAIDTGSQVNGIRVTVRRDSSEGAGPAIPLIFLGKIFEDILGKDKMDVVAFATAAFGYTTGLPPGPFNNIAINREKLEEWKNDPDKAKIFFMAPDGGDNAAWASGEGKTPNDNDMVDWITNGSPAVTQSAGVNVNNGKLANIFKYINDNAQPGSPTYDAALGGWLVVLPVVETTKFTGYQPVITFQPIIITSADKKDGIAFKLYYGPVPLPGTNPGGSPSQVYTLPKLVEVPLPESK